MDTSSLALDVFAPVRHARILDIGCGAGHLSRLLSNAGAQVVGVDPSAAALSAARLTSPKARFEHARAEALPFADDAFDHAVFLNSLHHVDPDHMDGALGEALRVTRPGGRLLIVEPVAAGPFFEVFRIIEDETEVRRQAQAAIERLVASGSVQVKRRLSYDRRETFADMAEFTARISGVDPARGAAIARHAHELSDLFERHSLPAEDGSRVLIQPLVAIVVCGKPTHQGASSERSFDEA